MTVSGSVVFSLSAADIVQEARSLIGIQADEDPIESHELARGLRWFNIMLKAWQADGVRTWTLTEGSFALVQGQASYSFAAGGDVTTVPFDMDNVRIYRGSTDLPMLQMSRDEYFSMPNKTAQGYPTQYYFDRQRDTATFYVWQAPDATGGTIKYTYRRIIDSIISSADTMDLPQEWYLAIIYGLAKLLIPQYGRADSNNAKLVIADGIGYYNVVKNFDTGEGLGSVRIGPSRFRRGGARNG